MGRMLGAITVSPERALPVLAGATPAVVVEAAGATASTPAMVEEAEPAANATPTAAESSSSNNSTSF